jgi:DNA (cytosine-5)-methyltransferase 1
MKRDVFTLPLHLGDELIIDNFAGGGGTSTGLEQAFGRPVDIAINHDPEALAMHAANHPYTKHLCESVWDVDPIKVTNNQPVGLVWLSPDCKHFSKAKGGKPVEKKIRGLAWVTLRWAAKCKPRVIMLENVEEFKTWGPLIIDADGSARPDPAKKGKTFASFVRQLEGHGYHVEHSEMRACDYGTPTIRKRFFLVARRDGRGIIWPKPTHGNPKTPAVQAGQLLPWRTAAECINWDLTCPSIFERSKPLAEATLRRIAKGIMRYVVNAADPFIVGQGGPVYSGKPVTVHQPFGTLTTENHRAVVAPTLVQVGYGEREGQAPRALDIEKPLGTVVGGASKHALVTAFLNEHANATQQRVMPADEPLRTVCAQVKGGHFSMVSAVLVDAAHGEVSPSGVKRWGQGNKDIEQPLGTVTASGNSAMACAFLAKHYTGVVGSDLEDPIGTVTSSDHHSLVTAHVTKFRTGSTGSAIAEPLPTITAGPKENPAGAPHALGVVTSNLVKLRGTSTAAGTDEPLGTVSAGGQHHAEVRAFLLKYYSTDQDPRLGEPLHTVTTKDRYGLVTIHGQDYQIVDIGLRMLAPRELYRAQGFPDDYVIGDDPDQGLKLPKSAQVRMCGNSVCPPLARALIEANFAHEREIVRAA